MKVSIKVQGGKDIIARLQQMPTALAGKVQRDALFAGAEPIRAEMAELAPVGDVPPHVADNIVIGESKRAQEGEVLVEVGPASGKGGNQFFYAHFLEYGTVHSRAQPFMRPAFDTKAGEALNRILAYFWLSIRRFLPDSGSSVRGGTGI